MRIGIDVGGTFTDLVLADASGATWVAKVPSVPADPSRGVVAALERLAGDLGVSVREILASCALFVHGSTVATNTLLEGKGAKVGLIATEGFRDTLEIRRGLREDQFNHRAPYSPVLVPRYLRKAVPGRIDAAGAEIEPLDLAGLDAIAADFEAEDVEAVAVTLLNSFLDDAHERAVADALADRWTGDWTTTSAAVSPRMGEYERTSTAVVNAALLPRIAAYLHALDTELTAPRAAASDPPAAVERRRRLRRAAHRAPGQSPAQRPRRRGRGTEPVPGGRRPRDRRLFARRQPDLHGNRGHVLRRAPDVGRRGGDPGRHHGRGVSRLDPRHRHPHRRRGRRHHRGGGRRRAPVRRSGRRRRRAGSGLLREGRAPPHRHGRATRARPTAARKVGGRHARPGPRSRPRGNPVGGRRAARTLDRRGRGRHR